MALFERIQKNKEMGPDESLAKADNIRDFFLVKEKIHKEVIEALKATNISDQIYDDRDHYKSEIENTIETLISREVLSITKLQKERLAKEIFNDVAGLGPIEPLLEDQEITEIMVNGPRRVYIEKKGKISLTDIHFRDSAHVMQVIDRIVSSVGRHIDEASPMVDARLSNGSRVNAVIHPVSLVGPVLTIRKFSKDPITVSDLIAFGSISPGIIKFLETCVRGKLNIIVTGGTGSGKTTLLNVLSGFIPGSERIVTIEDAAELQLRQEHVITMESRPANTEGQGQITIRSLVRNALRMRPDRLIIGEVRSEETLDMLQAMNTGHNGSMTTAHANSSRDLISRLETMVLMAGVDIPVKAIRQQIASAIDLIIHEVRMRDGSRKVINVTEVVGMEGDVVTLQDIYVYKGNRFMPTGVYPCFADKLLESGITLNEEWFKS